MPRNHLTSGRISVYGPGILPLFMLAISTRQVERSLSCVMTIEEKIREEPRQCG